METKDYYQPPAASAAVPEQFADAPLFAMGGRIGRVRYIAYSIVGGFLIVTAAGFIGALLAGLGGGDPAVAGMLTIGAGYTGAIVFQFVLAVRRCHDFNATGWLSLISVIPLANLALWFIPGTVGPNRFGLRPRPNSTGVLVLALLVPIGIGVVGILAAVALPAYNEYIDNANIANVTAHYEDGAHAVINEMRRYRAEKALGKDAMLPATAEAWIALINPAGVLAPNGDLAYQAGADVPADTGVIGVEVTGTAAEETLVVTLHRGEYNRLPPDRMEVRFDEL